MAIFYLGQYAAEPIVAKKAYSSIQIKLAYYYNDNNVYFDGIQLFREEYGSSYTYDKDGNVVSVKDAQGAKSTYKYNDNHDLTEEVLPNGAKYTYTYDSYHNVKTATMDNGLVYHYVYDEFGNNTSVHIEHGDRKLVSRAVLT